MYAMPCGGAAEENGGSLNVHSETDEELAAFRKPTRGEWARAALPGVGTEGLPKAATAEASGLAEVPLRVGVVVGGFHHQHLFNFTTTPFALAANAQAAMRRPYGT